MSANAYTEDLGLRLRAAFRSIGADIAQRAPQVDWHIEFPPSHMYDLVGLLIFADHNDPTTELAVITVELESKSGPTWTVDLVGRDSLVLKELSVSPDVQRRMADEAEFAVRVITDFAKGGEDLILRELTAS